MKKCVYFQKCKCAGNKFSCQIVDDKKMICLSCKKEWNRSKSDSNNIMSYEQETYTPAEIKEYPTKLYFVESSLESPYPLNAGKLRGLENTLEIPTRPKGGRGVNPWSSGFKKSDKTIILKILRDFNFKRFKSFAIPDYLGKSNNLKKDDIEWLYKTINDVLNKEVKYI